MTNFFYITREGDSLHLWAGPIGVHIWRHKGPGKRAALDWDGRWNEPMDLLPQAKVHDPLTCELCHAEGTAAEIRALEDRAAELESRLAVKTGEANALWGRLRHLDPDSFYAEAMKSAHGPS